jgi:hypothetical protein
VGVYPQTAPVPPWSRSFETAGRPSRSLEVCARAGWSRYFWGSGAHWERNTRTSRLWVLGRSDFGSRCRCPACRILQHWGQMPPRLEAARARGPVGRCCTSPAFAGTGKKIVAYSGKGLRKGFRALMGRAYWSTSSIRNERSLAGPNVHPAAGLQKTGTWPCWGP